MFYSYLLDLAEAYQLGFQDPSSPVMEGIINFYNYVFIYLTLVVIVVTWLLISIIRHFTKSTRAISHKHMIHGTTLEIVWTITPAVILMLIAFPSFQLLYLMDEVIEPGITIKVIGKQWYWTYEYSDYAPTQIGFDSYMIPESDLKVGDFRLLETDNHVVVPVDTHVRIVATGADVIHCWAVPSLGVKIDCIPGRLNQTSFIATREGVFYGQCSEVCGANHAYMPIAVEAVSVDNYCSWVTSQN